MIRRDGHGRIAVALYNEKIVRLRPELAFPTIPSWGPNQGS